MKDKVLIKKLWVESLPLETSFLEDLLKLDNNIMSSFGVASLAVKNTPKYKKSKMLMNMKLRALKENYIECFLAQYLKRKNVVISLKNKLILDYYSNKNKINTSCADKYDYDSIMAELDSLIKPEYKKVISPIKCSCRSIGFGFCFHR
jgi:hypothetical protein